MERLAIDMTAAITGRTGIARYVIELADAIERTPSGPAVTRFAIGRAVVPVPARVSRFSVPLRVVDQMWRTTGRPRIERLVGPVDVVHASGPVLVPARAPVVAVVHDVAALDHPALHPSRDVGQLRRYLADLERAAAVIAVSAATADRLHGVGVPDDRIHVVPNGRSDPPDPVDPPLAGSPYVLAVGAPVPRKGYDTLLRAVARLRDRDLALAVVGPHGSDDEPLAQLAGSLGITKRVHRAGPVSEAELAGWYRNASVLAAPSVDEGFGLPLIEALAWGVPVVGSDIAAFREVTGGHARLVPVGDDDALAAAIAEAVARPASVARDVELGRAHAARYTWDACAAATLAVHRLVT